MKTAIKRVAFSLGILLLMLPPSALFAETKDWDEMQIAAEDDASRKMALAFYRGKRLTEFQNE